MTEEDKWQIESACFNYLKALPSASMIESWVKNHTIGEVVDSIVRAGKNKTKVEFELRKSYKKENKPLACLDKSKYDNIREEDNF